MPKVSQAYKEEKIKDILQHALFCFADKGFQAATIDDIVGRSGMSKGTIYHYFSSKEEIYIRILESGTARMFEQLEAGFQGKSPADKLRLLIRRYREQELTDEWINSGRILLEFWLSSSRNEEMRKIMVERYERFILLVETILEEGKEAGEFRKNLVSRDASSYFWAMADGIFSRIAVIRDAGMYRQLWADAESSFFGHIGAAD